MRLRATRRIPTRFATRVEGAFGGVDVVVTDVTEMGAKADGLGRVPPGTACGLRILNDVVRGVVRWNAGDAAGILFDSKLTPRQLDVVRHRTTARQDAERPQTRRSHGFTELR